MSITKTERLTIRELNSVDAEFIFRLVNQESWIRYIGNKNINNLDDATKYITDGPQSMYQQHGFGLWAVELNSNQQVIGICGIIKRDTLPDIDLGFAFIDEFTGRGYAFEASIACLKFARHTLNATQILAIAMPENERSISLLTKLGFVAQDKIILSPPNPAIQVLICQLPE